MKTFSAKASEVPRKLWIIDANNQVLGQVAVKAANLLRGKEKAIYTPHVDTGDFVVVINAALVWLPLLLHLVAPGVTTRRLTAFNGWLRGHGNQILIWVLIAGGAIMIGNGIYGLAGG